MGAGVAELVDASDLGSGGFWPWGFDSLHPHQGFPGVGSHCRALARASALSEKFFLDIVWGRAKL